jgi:hypothetical protein
MQFDSKPLGATQSHAINHALPAGILQEASKASEIVGFQRFCACLRGATLSTIWTFDTRKRGDNRRPR